jgi:hypothetical protein
MNQHDAGELITQLRAAATQAGHNGALLIQAAEAIYALCDRISYLEASFEPDAQCPCCRRDNECEDDCTYRENDPDGAERMDFVRAVLRG